MTTVYFGKKIPAYILLLGFVMLALILFGPSPCGYAQDVKRILLVQSGHADSPWVKDVSQGVQDALKDSPVLLERVFMDAFRNPCTDWKVKAGRLVEDKISEFKPDAVIAVDDDAQIFVTQKYSGAQKPFFVFCGVNGDLEAYGLPAGNATGSVARPHFEEGVEFIRTLYPKIRKIAVLSDDSPDSMGAYAFLTHEKPAGVHVLGYHIIRDFSTWQERVKHYNVYADALFVYRYNTVKLPGTEESLPSQDVIRWTLNHVDIPVVGFFNFAVEDGMTAAVGESGYEHGMSAGTMALKLVNGVPLQNLPVQRAEKAYTMINLPAVQASGISLSEEQLTRIDWVKK